MKALVYSVPFILLLGGVAGMVGLSKMSREPPSSSHAKQSPLVETVRAEGCREGFRIRVDGEVVPYREIKLSAEVAGRVAKKSPRARSGTYVQKGDLLFEIDARDYELEVRRLKEVVNQAASSIEEADVEKSNVQRLIELSEDELELQRKDVARYELLKQKNATSASQLEGVRRAELQALNALQTLRNQILLINARRSRLAQEKERALTDLEMASLNLSRTRITSPIDGVIIEDSAEEDDYLAKGAPLAQLEDTSKVEVRFYIRLDQLRWLWNRQGAYSVDAFQRAPRDNYALPPLDVTVELELDGNLFAWPARLARYDGTGIHPATRTVPCIAVVDDPAAGRRVQRAHDAFPLPGPPTLLRGMFVSIEIPIDTSLDLVQIPHRALRPGKKVWVVDGGKLRVQSVRVAHTSSDKVVLLADPAQLAAGDHVVTSPLPMAVDGMELRLDVGQTRTALEGNDSDPF